MKKKRLTKKKKIVLFSLLGVIILIGGLAGYMYSQLNHVKIDKSNQALGIITNVVTDNQPHKNFDNQIINIVLFGIDRRDKSDTGRADSTMILTVDFKHNKLKLSSLMRDIYVDIDGYGKTKFNHAYSYGGATLAIKTINQTFGTDIRDYVMVDFFTLEKIIDKIGGVEIVVKEKEYPLINRYMNEVAKIEGDKPVHLTRGGEQLLDGKQAVAYARIRKVGDGDFERTERQRRVLSQMLDKVQNIKKSDMPSLAMTLLPYVETSLDVNTIMDLGVAYMKSGIKGMEQDRFPRDGYWESYILKGVWYMKFDEEETKNQLQSFIYDNEEPNKGVASEEENTLVDAEENSEATENSADASNEDSTKDLYYEEVFVESVPEE